MNEISVAPACAGNCKTEGVDREAQRRICHPERFADGDTSRGAAGATGAAGPAGAGGETDADLEWLRARVRRLNSEAGQLKMDLHDLAEALPDGWERIMDVARRTAEKYAELTEARRLLQALDHKLKG